MKAFVKVFVVFLGVPFGAAAAALGIIGIYSGWATPEAAFKWTMGMLPWIIGLSAFLAAGFVSVKDKHALAELTTPRIKIAYYGTDFSEDERDSTIDGVLAYIELTGLSHKRVDFHVWCSDAMHTERGKQNLLLTKREGWHRFLTRTEIHRLAVLKLEWNTVPAPFIRCLLPYQQHQDHFMSGGKFLINISAFGEMEPIHIQLRCWAEDKKFRVEEVKPMLSLADLRSTETNGINA
jgi:hypothetical protein